MPEGDIVYTGHYVDHELVTNLEADTALRMDRVRNGKAKRYLLTVGGAGAQQELFASIIRALLPEIREGKAAMAARLKRRHRYSSPPTGSITPR